MTQEQKTQEELLQAWMTMIIDIRGNRLLNSFSTNEMLICNLLFQQRLRGGPYITATDLCAHMRLLKSQINRILTGMESRGLIERFRSEADRRMICVRLRDEAIPLYRKEHEQVLNILKIIQDDLGEAQTQELAALLRKAATAVANYQTKRS